jgi:CCR4-NOT transcriptional regulation complex NOT5 subunit
MYITVSRNADLFVKRFSKYLSLFVNDIKYVPRGKTPLSKIFKSAIFLGHNYFLISRKQEKDLVSLLVYKINYKDKEFYPDKEIVFRIFEMSSSLSKKELNKIQKDYDFVDSDKIFYFLGSKNKGDYGIFKDDLKEKRYSFKFHDKDLGFFLTHIETKKM